MMKNIKVNVSIELSLVVPVNFEVGEIDEYLDRLEYSFVSPDNEVCIETTDMFNYDIKHVYFLPISPFASDNVWKVPNSLGTDVYYVTRKGDEWSCECQSFKYRGDCKHIQNKKKEL